MTDSNKKDDLDAVRDVVKALESFDEEEQKRIIRWASEKLGITDPVESPTAHSPLPASTSEMSGTPEKLQSIRSSGIMNIKTFVEEKNPKTDIHFAAVVAYYYQFEASDSDRKDSITANDLTSATRLANRNRLTRPAQTLVNAKNAGLLDDISSGNYSLNSVGENLVAMILPDSTSQKPQPKRKRRATKKNKESGKKSSSNKK